MKPKDKKKKNEQAPTQAPTQARSPPSPANIKGTSSHTQSSGQPVPPTLTKKVSFPQVLTRGRGMSYSPAEDEKAVRFSKSLVRGEGPTYNESIVRRDSSDASAPGRRVSPRRGTTISINESVPIEQLRDTAMINVGESDGEAVMMDSDLDSESNASFTDVVVPLKRPVETEPAPRRRSFDAQYHRPSAGKSTTRRIPGSMQVNVSGSRHDDRSEVDDKENYAAGFDAKLAKRGSRPWRPTSSGRLDTSQRKGTATVPTYNGRGNRLRANSDDEGMLGSLPRRRWPEPIFIWKDETGNSMPGHQNPLFALRERSDSQTNIQDVDRPNIGLISSKQQFSRKYQPPSFVDIAVDEGDSR